MNDVIQIFVAAPPEQVDEMLYGRLRALFIKYDLDRTALLAGVCVETDAHSLDLVGTLLCCSNGLSAWQESSQSACA